MLKISEIKISINHDEKDLKGKIEKLVNVNDVSIVKVLKKSIDARQKKNILFVYTVVFSSKQEAKILQKNMKNISLYKEIKYVVERGLYNKKIAVVGFGPSGMYSALCLAEAGFVVHVFERGQQVDERVKTVEKFWDTGILNNNSNVQFGEGGAGAFSDGKLTSRSKNIRTVKVINELIEAGAPKEIGYIYNPHVGTDRLRQVVINLRKKCIKLGVIFHFDSLVTDFLVEDNKCKGLVVDKNEYLFDDVVLAIGHSARDTFELLYKKGVKMENKPFAVGYRIEHPQIIINKSQFEGQDENPRLGSAEYRLTTNVDNRGVYTFCMCPGGYVIPSQSEENTIVINGMSNYKRDSGFANSAILASVSELDFENDSPLAGMHFQQLAERNAFVIAGADYKAPVQTVKGFLGDCTKEDELTFEPTYSLGYKFVDFNELYPKFINDAIKQGIIDFGKKLNGFDMDKAILTGVETRTSSPLRIVRESDSLQSVNTSNLYPCGEGSGYSGGIVSSALDGIRVSEQIMEKYKK